MTVQSKGESRMLVTGSVPPHPSTPTRSRRALAPFGSSRMLPRGSYLDEAVLAWEREHFFGGWQCVGRGQRRRRRAG